MSAPSETTTIVDQGEAKVGDSNSSAKDELETISSNSNQKEVVVADFKRVVLMGFCLKFGGSILTWNWGLAAGFYEFFIAVITMGIGFIMLGLCMGEIVSIMTFSGGYYGYARVILGPLGGYLVGCAGLLETVAAFSGYILKITTLFQVYFNISDYYQHYIWIISYIGIVVAYILLTLDRKLFWNIIAFITIGEIVILCIYLFSSMPHLDFKDNALQYPKDGSGFVNDDTHILYFNDFRLGVVFFNTFDMLTLTGGEVQDAKRAIPWALNIVICGMFVFAIWLMFTVVSQDPGEKALLGKTVFFPLVFGYEHRLNISYNNALFLAAFPIFPTAIVYLYLLIKQVQAMVHSRLLPSPLLWSIKLPIPTSMISPETASTLNNQIPLVALFVLCIAGWGINYFVWQVNVLTTSARLSGTATCFIYLAMFYCYVVFKIRYGHMERHFTNPLGMVAAFIGSGVFIILMVMLIAFNLEYKDVSILFTMWMSVMLVYYYCWVESRQCFSVTEQQVFFRAYIIKMKMRRKKPIFQKLIDDVSDCLTAVWSGFSCLRSLRTPRIARVYSTNAANRSSSTQQIVFRASVTVDSGSVSDVLDESVKQMTTTQNINSLPMTAMAVKSSGKRHHFAGEGDSGGEKADPRSQTIQYRYQPGETIALPPSEEKDDLHLTSYHEVEQDSIRKEKMDHMKIL